MAYVFDTDADKSNIYQNNLRLQQMVYPDGRMVYYQYGKKPDDLGDLMNRVTHITNSNGQCLAGYSRLGSGRVVRVDYAEPRLCCALVQEGTVGEYRGLDRFGRIKDTLWYNYGSSKNVVRVKHGYDVAGNRVWREDIVAKSQKTPVYLDEYYTYDGLNQLSSLNRGQLNQKRSGIVSAPVEENTWILDNMGNWSTIVQKTNGSTAIRQSRIHNNANEIIRIDGASDCVAYDAAGNLIKLPRFHKHKRSGPQLIPVAYQNSGNEVETSKSSKLSTHHNLIYDAWNRLVKVAERGVTLAEYQYDGRNFRTVKKSYKNGKLVEIRHFYYNNKWQVLEERVDNSDMADRQNIWGVRYIDDLILCDQNAIGSPRKRLYAMQDPNWNVVAIANDLGTVQERYVYTAYGNPTFLTASFVSRPSSGYEWDALYTGRQYDPATALYYYRMRYYGPELGRFLSRDPMGYEAGDLNLYRYVYNGPLTANDPSGMLTVLDCQDECDSISKNRVASGSAIARAANTECNACCDNAADTCGRNKCLTDLKITLKIFPGPKKPGSCGHPLLMLAVFIIWGIKRFHRKRL